MSLIQNMNLKLEDDEVLLDESDSVDEESLDMEEVQDETEELDYMSNELDVATEAISILEGTKGKEENVVKSSIMYTCGMLGMNYKESFATIHTEEFNVSLEESTNGFIGKIVEGIRKLWEKIKGFFKNVWRKIQVYYIHLTKNIHNVRKMVYGMRNKQNIEMEKSLVVDFAKDFYPYFLWVKENNSTGVADPNVFTYRVSEAVKGWLDAKSIQVRLNFIKDYSNLIKDFISKKDADEFLSKQEELFRKYNKQDTLAKNTIDGEVEGTSIWTSIDLVNKKSIKLYIKEGENNIESSSVDPEGDLDKNELVGEAGDNIVEMEYQALMNLAESVDSCKTVIKDADKYVSELSSQIDKVIKLLQTEEDPKIKEVIKSVNLVSKSLCVNYIQSIIAHIKIITKWIKLFWNKAKETTNLGVHDYCQKVREGVITEIKLGTDKSITYKDPKNIKVIEERGMCFIDPGEKFWIDAKEVFNGHPGGFVLNLDMALLQKEVNKEKDDENITLSEVRENSIANRDNIYKNSEANVYANVGKELGRLGLMFIDVEMYKQMAKDAIPLPLVSIYIYRKTLDFVYYHELGHLITGQQESVLPIDMGEDMLEVAAHGFIRYTYDTKENRADAYACLRTGLKPADVVKMRYEGMVTQLERMTNKRLMEKVEKAKDDMLANITKEMNYMRSYTKLSPWQYLRSKMA